MRTDILDLHSFYHSALGRMARRFVLTRLKEAWGEADRLSVAGFGYANPYLGALTGARRVICFAPAAQGVMRWPQDGGNRTGLVNEAEWPLPDACLDRVLVVHGLEEAPAPRRLMREIWRVLADDGRVVIIVAHRRGLWSVAGGTPFSAGRPYLKRQLNRLLDESMFRARDWSPALFFPPFGARFLLRAAPVWERAGGRVWPGLGGVLMMEAEKELMAPVGTAKAPGARIFRPAVSVKPSAAGSSVPGPRLKDAAKRSPLPQTGSQ